jgi:acyl dehydratase
LIFETFIDTITVIEGENAMSEIRKKTIEGLKVGDSFTLSRTFTEKDVLHFSSMTKNYNPAYFDEKFAQAKNLRGKICPGLLVGSLVTEIGGEIGWLASKLDLRFKKPVYIGDTVTCSLTISCMARKGLTEAKAICRNQGGEIVLEAFLKGYVPVGPEIQFLNNSGPGYPTP